MTRMSPSRSQFRLFRRIATCACLLILAVYFTSVLVFVRYYDRSFAFRFGEGGIGIYWRGDWEMRRTHLFNGGQWPLRSDAHFAGLDPGPDYVGGDPRGLVWETYELGQAISTLGDKLHNGEIGGFVENVGFSWPDIRLESEAACIFLPLGPAGGVSVITLGVLAYKRKRHRLGYCESCNYDLTGSVSGVCPECDSPTQKAPHPTLSRSTGRG